MSFPAGVRPSASVTCYRMRGRAIVQSAYDPLPPTAPIEARGTGPARGFGPGCDSLRRRRRTKAKLQTISATGGLLQLPSPLGNGAFVELAFQTQSGPVHGMAEVLSPLRKTTAGVLQPFRFIALEDDDHRRLRTSLDQVVDRSLLGLKSSAFTIPRTI